MTDPSDKYVALAEECDMDGEGMEDDSDKPVDHYNLVYWLTLLLGVGALLPWNAFITAVDYFDKRYPDTNIASSMSVAYQIPNFLGLLLMVKWGHKLTLHQRIGFGNAGNCFCVFSMFLLDILPLANTAARWLSLVVVFFSGCSAAVLQGGLFGLSAMFPSIYVQAVMSGNGISGFTVSLLRVVTKASLSDSRSGLRLSAQIYFIISSVVVVGCIVGHMIMQRKRFVKYHILKSATTMEANEARGGTSLDGSINDVPQLRVNTIAVLSKVQKFALSVFLVFFVTLGVFPGFTSTIDSNNGLGSWMPIVLITLFNTFDTVGRTLPGFYVIFTKKNLWIPVVVRLLFIPLWILCARPDIFHHDVAPCLIMILFATSNGYCSSLCMMFAPTVVDTYEREMGGIIMTFFLTLGLSVGSIFSFGLDKLL